MGEGRVVGEGFDQVEASLGASGHGDGYGSVEFDDWGRCDGG
jgi:hypothetical protein